MDDGRISRGARLQLATDTVQMVHGSVEGEPHSFSDTGGARLRQLEFVECLVDPEKSHLGTRKPLPEEREGGGQCDGWRSISSQLKLYIHSSDIMFYITCWSAKEVKPNRKSTILNSSNRINQNDLIVLVQFKTRTIRLETNDKCPGLKTHTCKY